MTKIASHTVARKNNYQFIQTHITQIKSRTNFKNGFNTTIVKGIEYRYHMEISFKILPE